MNRREFLKKGLEGIIISSVPLIYSCSKNPVESEFGRIIPWESIDGVNLGDTPDTVNKKLGDPDGGGEWDGAYAVGLLYMYEEGHYAGFEVLFIGYNTVIALSIRKPYSGTTKEGIGIGSSLKSLHDIYGVPNKITNNYEKYYKNDRSFGIGHNDNYIDYMVINLTHYFERP